MAFHETASQKDALGYDGALMRRDPEVTWTDRDGQLATRVVARKIVLGAAPDVDLGGTVYLSGGRLRPLLAADGQLYFSDGPHAAARAALGVAWDMAAHLSVLLSAGVEHLFGEASVATSKTFPVPAIGVIGRI